MLEGQNINLRLVRATDIDQLIEATNRMADKGPHYPIQLHTTTAFNKQFAEDGMWGDDSGVLLIEDKDHHILGYVTFFPSHPHDPCIEVGYAIYRPADRGHGAMTEALRIFSAYLFDLKPIARLQIATHVDNLPSQRVAEKVGYIREGILRKAWFLRGEYTDLVQFSLLRDECPSLEEVLT
jgi:[ribosomal protein S5]-alanine N-acetyltransferase